MRALTISLTLLLAACGGSDQAANERAAAPLETSAATTASYAGSGRDRLCLGGPNSAAAVISYGAGDNNCLVRGRIEGGALIPNGDDSCRIPVTESGGTITLGTPPPSCAYYCGPGASLAGKAFTRMAAPEPVTDIAGDPLC